MCVCWFAQVLSTQWTRWRKTWKDQLLLGDIHALKCDHSISHKHPLSLIPHASFPVSSSPLPLVLSLSHTHTRLQANFQRDLLCGRWSIMLIGRGLLIWTSSCARNLQPWPLLHHTSRPMPTLPFGLVRTDAEFDYEPQQCCKLCVVYCTRFGFNQLLDPAIHVII